MTTVFEKIIELEKTADAFGFCWEKPEQIMEQIESECQEIRVHLNQAEQRKELQEEIGDLFHAVFSLCIFCQFDPQDTLEKTTAKFDRRLSAVKDLANAAGLPNLQGISFSELMDFWKKAKQHVG